MITQQHISIANNAYEKIPFYKDKYSDFFNTYGKITANNFKFLPITTKHEVQNNWEKMFNQESFIGQECFCFNTSGSTGVPLKIIWTKNDYARSMFSLVLFRKKFYDINPSDKLCTFHSVSYSDTSPKHVNATLLNDGRVLSLERYIYDERILKKYVDYILEFAPTWIQAPISVFFLIYTYVSENSIFFPSLKYIELNGEFVTDETRCELEEYFKIPVSNMYGAVEFNGIAITCNKGHMHLFNKNVYVENVTIDGTNQLVITSLTNQHMPLIRYAIGDIGVIENNFYCPCGDSTQLLHLTKGRSHELISVNKSQLFDPASLLSIIRVINKQKNVIIHYYVKVKNNQVTLCLIVNAPYYHSMLTQKELIIEMFSRYISKEIQFCLELNTSKSVKAASCLPKNGFIVKDTNE